MVRGMLCGWIYWNWKDSHHLVLCHAPTNSNARSYTIIGDARILAANCKATAGRQLTAGVMVAANQSSALVCCIRSCSNQSPALYGYHQAGGGLSLTRRGTMQRDVQRGGTALPRRRIEEQAYNFLDSFLLVFQIRLLSTSLPRQHSPERLPHLATDLQPIFPYALELLIWTCLPSLRINSDKPVNRR